MPHSLQLYIITGLASSTLPKPWVGVSELNKFCLKVSGMENIAANDEMTAEGLNLCVANVTAGLVHSYINSQAGENDKLKVLKAKVWKSGEHKLMLKENGKDDRVDEMYVATAGRLGRRVRVGIALADLLW